MMQDDYIGYKIIMYLYCHSAYVQKQSLEQDRPAGIQIGYGPNHHTVQCLPWVHFPELKRSECESDHPSAAEVNNAWSFINII
jgi:hypothetical protein